MKKIVSSTDRTTFDRRPEQHERAFATLSRAAICPLNFTVLSGKMGKSLLLAMATSVGNRPRYSPAVDSATRPWRTRGLKRSFQSYARRAVMNGLMLANNHRGL